MTLIHHSIIGMPGSGKTTFLAALWHILNANEISSKFVLKSLIGDRTHLNALADSWRRCEEVPRTSMSAEKKVSIHVEEVASGKAVVLQFPDLSGESFELQLASRSCLSEYVDDFEGDGGILLFVTANRVDDGQSILDIPKEIRDHEAAEEIKDWSPKYVPIQVNLVELLQFLLRPPFTRKMRRVAIVISAWDLVATTSFTPETWLKAHLPLLHQFLTSNPLHFKFTVYGISAQGGDLTTAHKDELAEKIPSTRISCVGENSSAHDLTSPIAWLMSSD